MKLGQLRVDMILHHYHTQLLQSLDSESKVNNTLSDDNSKSYSLKDLRRPATLHFPFVACFEKPKKFQFKVITIS